MKIKAYQIAPEYQESPMSLLDECLEGLEIYGNRDYLRHTSATFDEVLNCLDYGDFSAFEFTGHKAERLEELYKYGTQGANNEAIIAEALSIVTGQRWEYKQISGIYQSDWNYIYYRPDEWGKKALEYFEIEYFNTGDEWRIEDEEGNDFGSGYTHELDDDGKKQEIAENIGVDPCDVTLYLFDGWKKTAKYKEV